ncbi:MAG: peptidyl-prolyl cis-trans isomerase, EpsD family [Proteobacteria bacterium]|uniref:EpsD family peptidyl-prolyl cis-trans isomerase n=1 Tax=Aquabacterium sp. TaxID=1872578 RepID=UPI0035C7321A|nr:peptidyl-prolyl cis-trans isomerase, EpsD family [Pseudomonadota bacterium]
MNKTWVCAAAVLVLLGGCDKKPAASSAAGESQVAALVNNGEISVHQVETLLRLQPALGARFGEQASPRALDNLIEQELAAQAAIQAGLDTNPQTLQALALARREVLARVYQDQLADKVALPDTAAVERYYDEHPELFSQRRQYLLEETVVQVPGAEADAWQSKVQSMGSVEELQAWFVQQKAARKSRRFAQWAEGLPLDLLPSLAKLKPGQSLALRRPDSLYVLTVLKTEESPVLLGQATPAIQAALMSQRRQEAVRDGMTRLREQAKITRLMPLPGASSAASAPLPPASADSAAASAAR